MSKRRMIFVPEVNPKSFLFFFERGNNGTSWSIRDYSIPHRVKESGPSSYPLWNADDIHLKSRHSFDAPTVPTTDLSFWHGKTIEFNERYLGPETAEPVPAASASAEPAIATPSTPDRNIESNVPAIPVLHPARLYASLKGRKAQDMERIFHSPNSEDWVTWNFFQILLEQYPTGWWGHIVGAARRRNSALDLRMDDRSLPELDLWRRVNTPPSYEALSRQRMLASGNPVWMNRAQSPEPVEGASEIDVAFSHDSFLIYAEAKLGSDISMGTKYDPARNQIARNIDCLLEEAHGRDAYFWMLVKDEAPGRAYLQLMNEYRDSPALLAQELPHRDPETLSRIARNLTLILWSDFAELVCAPGLDYEANAVKRELQRRIQS